MKPNDLTWFLSPYRKTRWKATVPVEETRFIPRKTRYATPDVFREESRGLGYPLFFPEFSFRIQQERGEKAARRATRSGHIDLGASTLQTMNSEKLVDVQ